MFAVLPCASEYIDISDSGFGRLLEFFADLTFVIDLQETGVGKKRKLKLEHH